jgi:hypothetical protein
MPYEVVKRPGSKSCYHVVDPLSGHVFSKRCQSKKLAQRQRVAIALSESRKTGDPIKNYFIK